MNGANPYISHIKKVIYYKLCCLISPGVVC